MNTFLNGALFSRLKKKFGFVFFFGSVCPRLDGSKGEQLCFPGMVEIGGTIKE